MLHTEAIPTHPITPETMKMIPIAERDALLAELAIVAAQDAQPDETEPENSSPEVQDKPDITPLERFHRVMQVYPELPPAEAKKVNELLDTLSREAKQWIIDVETAKSDEDNTRTEVFGTAAIQDAIAAYEIGRTAATLDLAKLMAVRVSDADMADKLTETLRVMHAYDVSFIEAQNRLNNREFALSPKRFSNQDYDYLYDKTAARPNGLEVAAGKNFRDL